MEKLREAYNAVYGRQPPDGLAPDELADVFLDEIFGRSDISRDLQRAALEEIVGTHASEFSLAIRQWADGAARTMDTVGVVTDRSRR